LPFNYIICCSPHSITYIVGSCRSMKSFIWDLKFCSHVSILY